MSQLEQILNSSEELTVGRSRKIKLHGPPNLKLTLGEEAKLAFQDISSIPTKTPVSVLQELLCRRGKTPIYELVQIEGAIHEPIFRYRVYHNSEYMATGTGRSKKDAKHAAAQKLLELLVGKITLEEANATSEAPGKTEIVSVSPFEDRVMGNPVGWLQELCMSKRWPPPFYKMEHEEGLPHERVFTISCQVLKSSQTGTGKSKKLAKRVAAYKMWQALQDMPQEGCNAALEEENKESSKSSTLQENFGNLKDGKMKQMTPSHTHKLSSFHKLLRQCPGPKLQELQTTALNQEGLDHKKYLSEIAEENQFETTYVDIEEKTYNSRHQCLLQLCVQPVAVCYGWGKTVNDAQTMSAKNALEYLKIVMKQKQ